MTVDKVDALRRSPLFELLSEGELQAVAALSRPLPFAPGEIVFREGEVGDALYVLASGEVEISVQARGTEKVIAIRAAPDAVGEISLVDRKQRSATVRARFECVALQLTAESFASFRRRSRDAFTLVLMNIARVLSSRLRETNAKLASLL